MSHRSPPSGRFPFTAILFHFAALSLEADRLSKKKSPALDLFLFPPLYSARGVKAQFHGEEQKIAAMLCETGIPESSVYQSLSPV